MARLDWLVQMLAQDDPENIKILRDGEPEKSPEQIKILSRVDAWDTMRKTDKTQFLQSRIPVKLREAMERHRHGN